MAELGERHCRCGATNSWTAEFCRACLGNLAETTVSVVPQLGPQERLSPPVAPVEPAPAAGGCPRHPGVTERLICPRCGGFYCQDCHPDSLRSERGLCPDCRARAEDPAVRERLLYRDMGFVLLGVAASVLVFGCLLPLIAEWGRDAAFFFLWGGIGLTLPFLLLAGLVVVIRHPVSGWCAVLATGALALLCLITEAWLLTFIVGFATGLLVMQLVGLRQRSERRPTT